MTENGMRPSPLVLTDDEVMALAAVSGRSWWSPLRSVDTTDEADMVPASARGLRSLGVRGLITEDGRPTDSLALLTTCLGTRPWATLAVVDEHDRTVPESPVLSFFRAGDSLVASRSDVSGTHLLHEFELDHAVELIVEHLTEVASHDVAVVFTSAGQRPAGGLRRRGTECNRLDATGKRTEIVAREAGVLSEAVRSFWTAP